MAEQIYTIPVNDAFDSGCECPVCAMNRELENNAIEYTMGPSYMEDDNRKIHDPLPHDRPEAKEGGCGAERPGTPEGAVSDQCHFALRRRRKQQRRTFSG